MLAFFQTVFTFYHQGFELAKDFEHYKRALQINIQNVRNDSTLLLQLLIVTKNTLAIVTGVVFMCKLFYFVCDVKMDKTLISWEALKRWWCSTETWLLQLRVCRHLLNRSSVGALESVLQHCSLISERLECISKGKPTIFDKQRLLTRTVSTQAASTRKRLSRAFVCLFALPDKKSVWGHAVGGERADEEDQGGSSGVQTDQSHQLWRLPLCARKAWGACPFSREMVQSPVSHLCAWFLQDLLRSVQVGSNVTVHLSKNRRSCTWWPLTTGLAGSLWVAKQPTKHFNPNCAEHLLNRLLFCIFFPGWERVRHTEVLLAQNHRHAGQKVLLRPGHNRPVHHCPMQFLCHSASDTRAAWSTFYLFICLFLLRLNCNCNATILINISFYLTA